LTKKYGAFIWLTFVLTFQSAARRQDGPGEELQQDAGPGPNAIKTFLSVID
jgi:hypothetical protein